MLDVSTGGCRVRARLMIAIRRGVLRAKSVRTRVSIWIDWMGQFLRGRLRNSAVRWRVNVPTFSWSVYVSAMYLLRRQAILTSRTLKVYIVTINNVKGRPYFYMSH